MPFRTIAIGDIHGCSAALATLVAAIDPQPDDTLVTLGDYLDRGPDSRGVLNQLLTLAERCRLVPLLGNHEEMMLGALEGGKSDLRFWIACGGDLALDSYGSSRRLDLIPREHRRFVAHCRLWHATDSHFFVHASYDSLLPLDQQDRTTMLWRPLGELSPGPHVSGKIALVGHTPQTTGDILDLGHLICIDTGCCYGGWLTALDVGSGQVWQVDGEGRLRA